MTAREEALALLRERFPEPWKLRFVQPPDYTDRLYAVAVLPGKRVPDEAVRVEGECAPDHMSAARACIAAWDEATKGERSAVVSAARAITSDAVDDMAAAGHRAVDIALAALAAERALADRLAEALADYCNGLPSHGAQSAIAAWRAARGKA